MYLVVSSSLSKAPGHKRKQFRRKVMLPTDVIIVRTDSFERAIGNDETRPEN